MKNYFKDINRSIVAVMVLVFAFTTCEYEQWSPYKSNAEINAVLVSFQASTISGMTIGDPTLTWTLSVIEGSDFCTAVTKAGFAGQAFSLKFSANNTNEERTARATIIFSDGFTKIFTIRQLVMTDNPDFDRTWAEQPDYLANEDYIYKTYYTTLSDRRRVRNFSVCYDTDKMCSRWVAYPVHSIYTSGRDYEVGSTTAGRTNAWAFDDAETAYKYDSNYNRAYTITSTYDASIDTYNTYTNPIIPQKRQPDIRFSNGFGSGWARGHMLPSANRYNTWQTNAQTCYATNIMVQQYGFNGGAWATLENKERTKSCTDTLFVVVGTLFEDNKTVNRNNRVVGVPSHCYKLLLRTKSGNTRKHISEITSADELICIGFLYENSAASENTSMSAAAISVAEIERRSGFTFFRNINPAIADKVKAQKNLSDWNF